MQRERIKTLEEIMRNSPEARAYNAELSASMAAKRALQPEPEPECPTCGGIGFVRADLPTDHPLFGKPFPCPNPECPTLAARRAERYAKLCTLAQIPKEYQWLTFAEWDVLAQHPGALDGKRDALGSALAFVAARDRGFRFTLDDAAAQVGLPQPELASREKCSIAFSGANGVGKTSLAVCIARVLIEASVPVVYIRMMEFFDALKERFKDKNEYALGGDADDEAGVMRTYQQAPVLLIDEFPREATPWRRERAEALVNYRYTHQMPTIITTNLTADELMTIWHPTTAGRVQAMSHWILIGGIELRPREDMVRSR
jgi:DNA replication protein DnaC